MQQMFGARTSARGSLACMRRIRTQCSYVPDYSSPDPSDLRNFAGRDVRPRPVRMVKNFWEYQSPRASVGSPDGYQLQPVTIPVYSADGGGGGGGSGWGGGGWGRGGEGGDPMKGFTYLFAVLLFGAGLAAYLKKGSSKSLLISSGVAVLLLVSASLMGHPTYRIGTLLALATCLSLAGLMGYRAKESGKVVPAGVVAALSALMSIGYVISLV